MCCLDRWKLSIVLLKVQLSRAILHWLVVSAVIVFCPMTVQGLSVSDGERSLAAAVNFGDALCEYPLGLLPLVCSLVPSDPW